MGDLSSQWWCRGQDRGTWAGNWPISYHTEHREMIPTLDVAEVELWSNQWDLTTNRWAEQEKDAEKNYALRFSLPTIGRTMLDTKVKERQV